MSLNNKKSFKLKDQKGYTLVKLQYLSFQYFQYQPAGLINYSAIDSIERHKIFIEKSSNVWCDKKSNLFSIKDKEEQYQISSNSIRLFDIIRTKIGDKIYYSGHNLMPNIIIFINAPNIDKDIKELQQGITTTLDIKGLNICQTSQIIMGNIKMTILDLQASVKIRQNIQNQNKSEEKNKQDEVCYFCSKQNKLVYICECYGKVHLQCLSKSQERNNLMQEIIQKRRRLYKFYYNCKRCKDLYGVQMQDIGNIKKFIYWRQVKEEIKESFTLLTQINRIQPTKQEHKHQKQFILLYFQAEKDILIGRQLNNDISIDQLSVSRRHSKISYNDISKKYVIFNLNAKYGTLVKWKGEKLQLNNKAMLIYNRNIIEIKKMQNIA